MFNHYYKGSITNDCQLEPAIRRLHECVVNKLEVLAGFQILIFNDRLKIASFAIFFIASNVALLRFTIKAYFI